MKKIILSIISIIATSSFFAQSKMDEALALVEQNNTTLKALRETADAEKLQNRTGIYMSDPEIAFNYLWGNPSSIGKRQDISIKQTFDFATTFGFRNKVAIEMNNLVEWRYKGNRMSILLEAKQYFLDIIYYNALLKELYIRLEHAESIAKGQKERLDRGDGNVLEYNNVQLNLSMVKGEISRVETERKGTLAQLKRLNGGIDFDVEDSYFMPIKIPLDFNIWYANAEIKNPLLSYVKHEIELAKKQLSLNKIMNLPSISAGYMSENVVGQRYQGVSLGITIPLWSNKNRVKQALTAIRAAESRASDAKQQFFSQLEILYSRILGLKRASETYRESLSNANNSKLLKKALDVGEISLLDYIIEIGLYYNTINQALQAERDYQKAFAELSAVEL